MTSEPFRITQAVFTELPVRGGSHWYFLELSNADGVTGLAEFSYGVNSIAVARAIVSEPRLVLADEPTANLDSETGSALMDLMSALNQEKGTSFLFSTHDPSVMSRSKEIIRLHDGQIASRESVGNAN